VSTAKGPSHPPNKKQSTLGALLGGVLKAASGKEDTDKSNFSLLQMPKLADLLSPDSMGGGLSGLAEGE